MNPSLFTGNLHLEWDRTLRLVIIRGEPGARLTGKDANILNSAIGRWMNETEGRVGILVDARGVRSSDAEYRRVSGTFHRAHRDRLRVAVFNLNPLLRVAAEMMAIAIRINIKAFADETAARAWLRRSGIDAPEALPVTPPAAEETPVAP